MSTPLPEPVLSQKYHHDPRYDIAYYTADQLKSYGAAEYKRALDDAAEYLQQASAHEEDSTELAFEAWWLSDGQFCRAGGGDYEKTFAWRAWEASLAIPVQAQPVQQEPAAWEHCFVDPSKKILSYTKTCAGFPPRDDAYQINPLFLAAGAQPVQQEPITAEAAYDMGANGGIPSETERLLFEAWMRGHCWAVIGEWNGKSYTHKHEATGFVHGGAMDTRRLWAAWRDRAALSAPVQAQEGTNTTGTPEQERKPLNPCVCYDDAARKYCTKKRECTRCEASGIKEQP